MRESFSQIRVPGTSGSVQGIGNESFEEMVDHLAAGVIVLQADESGLEVLYVSKRAAGIFEVTVDDIGLSIGSTHLLNALSVPSAAFIADLEALEEGQTTECVARVTTATGRKLWVSLLANAAVFDGKIRYYITIRDVTERTEEERRLVWHEAKYKILSHSSGVILFDYDPAADVCTLELADTQGKQTERVIEGLKKRIKSAERVVETSVPGILAGIDMACARPNHGSFELQLRGPNGEDKWNRATYTSVGGEDGEVYRVVGRIDDINDEKKSARSQRFAIMRDESFRAALLKGSHIAVEFDLSTRRRVALELVGGDDFIPSETMLEDFKRTIRMQALPLDLLFEDFVHLTRDVYMEPSFRPSFDAFLASMRTRAKQHGSHESDQSFEARMLALDGSFTGYRWMRFEYAYLPSRVTGRSCLLILSRDIDDEKRRELALLEDAQHDSLTGLLNRSAFELKVLEALGHADKTHDLGAFLIFDLDDFKGINDRFGHDAGDTALKSMAKRLTKTFRSNDVVGRFGGDEFMVFMTDLPDVAVVTAKANAFCSEASTTFLPDTDVSLSCSCGAAIYHCDGSDYSELFKSADAALYKSKDKGKGVATVSDN